MGEEINIYNIQEEFFSCMVILFIFIMIPYANKLGHFNTPHGNVCMNISNFPDDIKTKFQI